MELDRYLPHFDHNEVHERRVEGSPPFLYPVVRHLDFSSSWITRTLFFLRGLDSSALTLDRMLEGDEFEVLHEDPPHEFVIGALVSPRLKPVRIESDETFHQYDAENGIRIAWNFTLSRAGDATLARTETRIQCLGAKARRRFGLYWFFIRPFSGWIRLEMLRILRRQARVLARSSPATG